MGRDKYDSRIDNDFNYNYDTIQENIMFLTRIRACITGEIERELIIKTIEQIDAIIKEEKKKIQFKKENRSIRPNLL